MTKHTPGDWKETRLNGAGRYGRYIEATGKSRVDWLQ